MLNDPLLDQIYGKLIEAGSHDEVDLIVTAAESALTQHSMDYRRRFWRDLRDRLSSAVTLHKRNQKDIWDQLLRGVSTPIVLKAQGGDALGDLYNYAKGQAAANARRA